MTLDVKVCTLAHRRVQLKEKLVIDERGHSLLIIFESEHFVNESEGESLILEVIIDCSLIFANCPRWEIFTSVLALPELQLEVQHVPLVKVTKKLVVIFHKAIVLVDSELLDLTLILKVEKVVTALSERNLSLRFVSLAPIIDCLIDVLHSEIAD